MRELKAGLGLVFGTLAGWLYFFLILGTWFLLMIGASYADFRDMQKTGYTWFMIYFWFLPVWIGAPVLAAGYRKVLSCGGLFCVPRLEKGMKRFAIISGFLIALMTSSSLLLMKGLSWQERYVYIALSFTLATALFFAYSIPSPLGNKRNLVSLLTLVLWVVLFVRLVFAGELGIKPLEGWPWLLAAGIFLCVIHSWPYTDKQIKSAHRQMAGSSTDINEQPQLAKLRIASAVEQFFIGRLNRCSKNQKCLWGAIYLCLGIHLSRWKQIFSLALAVMFFFGFMPEGSTGLVFFMTMLILGWGQILRLPVHSQMLVQGGRSQRIYGTIAAAIGFSLAIGLMFVVIAGVSQLTALIIPNFVFRGQQLTFSPLSMYSAYIVIGIIPVFFGIALYFERAPLLTTFVVILISIPAIAFLPGIISAGLGWLLISLIVISCWAFLIFVSRSICREKDLILQTDKS